MKTALVQRDDLAVMGGDELRQPNCAGWSAVVILDYMGSSRQNRHGAVRVYPEACLSECVRMCQI